MGLDPSTEFVVKKTSRLRGVAAAQALLAAPGPDAGLGAQSYGTTATSSVAAGGERPEENAALVSNTGTETGYWDRNGTPVITTGVRLEDLREATALRREAIGARRGGRSSGSRHVPVWYWGLGGRAERSEARLLYHEGS